MKKRFLLLCVVFLFSMFSVANALTIQLTKSNVDLGVYGDYVTVTVSDTGDGEFTFNIDANDALLNPNDNKNFGVDKFAFNSTVALTESQFHFADGSNWGVTIDPNNFFSIFGLFDFGTAGQKTDPLSFYIDGLDNSLTDAIFNVQNPDGYTMVAHVGAFSDSLNGQTSAWFSDGEPYNPVPEPSTMLLLGTSLIGLAGASRKKLFRK